MYDKLETQNSAKTAVSAQQLNSWIKQINHFYGKNYAKLYIDSIYEVLNNPKLSSSFIEKQVNETISILNACEAEGAEKAVEKYKASYADAKTRLEMFDSSLSNSIYASAFLDALVGDMRNVYTNPMQRNIAVEGAKLRASMISKSSGPQQPGMH